MSASEKFAAIALLINVGTILVAGVTWWKNSLRKGFAAERAFNHLERNQEQIKTAIEQLQESQEASEREIAQLRGSLQALVGKFID